jgi:glucosamine kinase
MLWGMRMVLGLDGGGTKTECVLMDESRAVRARGRSGASNPTRVGFDGALVAVSEAARLTIQNAGIGMAQISGICAGLAGAAQTEAKLKLKKLFEKEFPGKFVHVCADLDLTLEATGSGPAIVLIAGTGSVAVGRGCDGQTARVGGHGYLLDDEGSAYDIGRRAVRAALRAEDRGEKDSALVKRILDELGASGLAELQLRVYEGPDQVFPRVFPVVAAAAGEGDETARSLLYHAAANLSALVSELVIQLQLKAHKFLLVKRGGMVGPSAYFDEVLDAQLLRAAPLAEFGNLTMTDAEAAASMALRLMAEMAHEGK